MSFCNELPRNNAEASALTPLCTVKSVFAQTFGEDEYACSRGTVCDVFPVDSHMLWNGDAMLMRWKLTQEFDFVRDLAIVLPLIPGVRPDKSVLNVRLAVDGDMADFMYRANHVYCATKCENRHTELFREIDGDVALAPLPLGLSWIPMALLGASDVRVLVEIPSAYRSVRDRIRLVGMRYTIREESRAKLVPMINTRYEFLMSSSRMMSAVVDGANFRRDITIRGSDPIYRLFVLGADPDKLVNVQLLVKGFGCENADTGVLETRSAEVILDQCRSKMRCLKDLDGWETLGLIIPIGDAADAEFDNRGCTATALTFSEGECAVLTIESEDNMREVKIYSFYYKKISVFGGTGGVECSISND
jgi:hypothetical protein